MSKRKLLLADDSMTIQKVVNLTFADEGIEVFTVGNGSLAIEKLSEIEPDLVLADVHMPGLNGYEVCEQIRQNPQFQNVPVMLLVGSFEPFDEREAQRVGANDFLTKPFQSIRQLIQKVTTLLDNPKSETGRLADQAEISATVETEVSGENAPVNVEQDFYVETFASLENDLAESSSRDLSSRDLSDTALDDEMIETSSVSNFDNGFSVSMPSIQLPEQNSFDENEMTLEADEGESETTTSSNSISSDDNFLAEETPLEMRRTEPLSYDDIQDINSSMLASPYLQPNEQQQDEPQNSETEKTNVLNESITPTDDVAAESLPTNGWEQQLTSNENLPEEFEVELDLPFSEEQGFQDADFDLIGDEADQQSENVLQTENYNFSSSSSARTATIESMVDDEPLELDLADADLLQIDDEDSILDLDNEETVDEMLPTEFEVLPAMHEAVVRQNFSEQSSSSSMAHQISSQTIANMHLGFPPEVIEAIAQLVIEKLSDKVIEKIAWEIVPDRFDLIVRKQMEQRDR